VTDIRDRIASRFGPAAPTAVAEPIKPEVETDPPRPRPRVALICGLATGVVIVVVGGFFGGRLSAPSPPVAPTTSVLATAVAMPAGAQFTSADVRSITLAGRDRSHIPAEDQPGMMGMVATHTMAAGTLLTSGDLGHAGVVPGPYEALVGLSLKGGQYPSGGIAVGDSVSVVVVPSGPQGPQTAFAAVSAARVWSVTPDGPGSISVTVVVPANQAMGLAAYAASGEIAVIRRGS